LKNGVDMLTKTRTNSPRANKWNYRVISAYCGNGEFEYAIHEVYYNEAGEPTSWSEKPAVVLAGEPEGIQCQIGLFQKALEKPWLSMKTDRDGSWLEPL